MKFQSPTLYKMVAEISLTDISRLGTIKPRFTFHGTTDNKFKNQIIVQPSGGSHHVYKIT